MLVHLKSPSSTDQQYCSCELAAKSASSSHVYTQKRCCGPSNASHSLLMVLQSQRLMLILVTERHTPLEGTYLHMPRQRLRNISCLIAAWDTNPTLGLWGTRYAQGRVYLASIVFRKNRSQDAGATEASALEDGAPVGTQDLDLKDPGSKASCLPSWGCGGECLWELCLAGDPRVIRCTEGTQVVKDAAGGEMMKSPSSLGGIRGSTSMFSECSVLFHSA